MRLTLLILCMNLCYSWVLTALFHCPLICFPLTFLSQTTSHLLTSVRLYATSLTNTRLNVKWYIQVFVKWRCLWIMNNSRPHCYTYDFFFFLSFFTYFHTVFLHEKHSTVDRCSNLTHEIGKFTNSFPEIWFSQCAYHLSGLQNILFFPPVSLSLPTCSYWCLGFENEGDCICCDAQGLWHSALFSQKHISAASLKLLGEAAPIIGFHGRLHRGQQYLLWMEIWFCCPHVHTSSCSTELSGCFVLLEDSGFLSHQ